MTTCLRCGKDFKRLDIHITKLNPCKLKYLDITYKEMIDKYDEYFEEYNKLISEKYKCEYCGRIYTHSQTFYSHKKHDCKKKPNNNNSKTEEIIEEEIIEEEKNIEEIIEEGTKKLEEKNNKKKYVKKKIPSLLRRTVWNKNIGVEVGKSECFIGCGLMITKDNYECGHIISEKEGGISRLDNLLPICSNCNKSIGSRNMIEFCDKYGLKIGKPKYD